MVLQVLVYFPPFGLLPQAALVSHADLLQNPARNPASGVVAAETLFNSRSTNPEPVTTSAQAGPELLVSQVRDALASLYDLPYLQSHPLARLLPRPSNTEPADPAQLLHHLLLNAIEHLRPGSEADAVPRYRIPDLNLMLPGGLGGSRFGLVGKG